MMPSNCQIHNGPDWWGGYPQVKENGKTWYAHRLAWTKANGPIPKGIQVLHRCDNPRCVNVDHLFLGTQKDNIHDMMAKGRMNTGDQTGVKNGRAKLTEKQVLEIRKLDPSKIWISDIARKYGVGWTAIDDIIKRKSWRNI